MSCAIRIRYTALSLAGWLASSLVGSSIAFGAYDEEPRLNAQHIASLAAAFDATIPTSSGRFATSGIAGDMDAADDFLRLESSWTVEREDAPHRLRVGDTVSNPGAWGSAVRFAGVQFGTRFDLRADLLHTSRLPLAGIAIVPSALDAVLAANGALDESLLQRFGPFSGRPSVASANSLMFAAQDAVGRQTTFTKPLLAKHQSAQPGCEQFSIGVGRAREDYALVSDRYGPLFANSTVVCGTESGFTIEAHGEYLEDHAGIAGLNVLRAIPLLGSASVAVAASENAMGSGWLVLAGLEHSTQFLQMNVRARLQSPKFRELGSATAPDAVEQRWLATLGAKLGDSGSLAVAYASQKTFALRRTDIVTMTQSIELGRKGTISVVANRTVNDDETDAAVKVSYSLALRN